MRTPSLFAGRLDLPVLVSPMFLVSGPDLVISACRAGLIGSFPALNHRTSEGLEEALARISEATRRPRPTGGAPAPYAVNLILHQSNPRLETDFELCLKYETPLLITSLGIRPDLIRRVHEKGGLVFHDVTTLRHARKAAEAGVDGLILVCAGAGGHAGVLSPFAFLSEVRRIFDGIIVLAGAITDGRGIAAARILGADLAYMGTRFIATQESSAPDEYKQMLLAGESADVIYTSAVSGVPGNFLRPSIRDRGLDPDNLTPPQEGFRPTITRVESEAKAWKHIWSAGQGIGAIDDLPPVGALVERLAGEYKAALHEATTA